MTILEFKIVEYLQNGTFQKIEVHLIKGEVCSKK